MFHTLMMPVRDDGKGANVLRHAAVLANRFGARVRVVHCHPRTEDLMPFGVAIPKVVRRQIEEAAQQNVLVTKEKLFNEFRALAADLGLPEERHQPGKPSARFIEYEGKQVDAVRHLGRLADLVCVSQPDRAQNLGANTLKAALFSSGRPVLMCPETETVSEGFADHVAIGWNGSLEATRAVALSMPLIENAKSVAILSTGATAREADAGHLRRYLELKGVDSTVRTFAPRGSVVGGQLLEQCQSVGAGVLVMGAYHDSYERETVFGGNSQAVVDGARIPVVLVH